MIIMILQMTFLWGGLGPWEIGMIALAILLLFGGRKIPELMRGLGSGITEFKKGIKEGENEDKPKTKSKKSK
jgi:sec-independent protein translocase protein TatA